MNTTAITWLGRQIAWEARLGELRTATITGTTSGGVTTDSGEREEMLEAA